MLSASDIITIDALRFNCGVCFLLLIFSTLNLTLKFYRTHCMVHFHHTNCTIPTYFNWDQACYLIHSNVEKVKITLLLICFIIMFYQLQPKRWLFTLFKRLFKQPVFFWWIFFVCPFTKLSDVRFLSLALKVWLEPWNSMPKSRIKNLPAHLRNSQLAFEYSKWPGFLRVFCCYPLKKIIRNTE